MIEAVGQTGLLELCAQNDAEYLFPPFQSAELTTDATAIEILRSFDPLEFSAAQTIYGSAQRMYVAEKASSSLGALKDIKTPRIDLKEPGDVAGLRHHVVVHAVTGLLRAGVSDASSIPMWDRQAFMRGAQELCPDLGAYKKLVEVNDARSINALRGYTEFLMGRAEEAIGNIASLDSALAVGQVTRVDRTGGQLGALTRVMDDYDEFSNLLVAKTKHLLWLTDVQQDPRIRELLLPELQTLLDRAQKAGISRQRFDIDLGVDTGASEGTFRPPYNITAFTQLRHTGLDEYAVPDRSCDVVTVDDVLSSIGRGGETQPTSHKPSKYLLPWDGAIQHFEEPQVDGEVVLSGGSVHDVVRQTYDNGRVTVFKKRNSGSPAELPNMITEASEMAFEAHALRIAGALMPDIFPRLVDATNAHQGEILMEELLPGSKSLKEVLSIGPPSASLILRIARAVGKFHRLSDDTAHDGFRGEDYFRGLLEYRFGLADTLPISGVIDELMEDEAGKGIILGGLSPKNIQVEGQQVGILDLETACVGNRNFDVGFNLGHLLLHAIGMGRQPDKVINLYRFGYEQANYRLPFNSRVLARTVLSSMVYRLTHPEAAYIPKGFNQTRIDALLERASDILDDKSTNLQVVAGALTDV